MVASRGALLKMLRIQSTERAPMFFSLCSVIREFSSEIPWTLFAVDEVGFSFIRFGRLLCILRNKPVPIQFFPRTDTGGSFLAIMDWYISLVTISLVVGSNEIGLSDNETNGDVYPSSSSRQAPGIIRTSSFFCCCSCAVGFLSTTMDRSLSVVTMSLVARSDKYGLPEDEKPDEADLSLSMGGATRILRTERESIFLNLSWTSGCRMQKRRKIKTPWSELKMANRMLKNSRPLPKAMNPNSQVRPRSVPMAMEFLTCLMISSRLFALLFSSLSSDFAKRTIFRAQLSLYVTSTNITTLFARTIAIGRRSA